MIRQLILILFISFTAYAYAETTNSKDTYLFTTAHDSKRFQSLTKEIRCVVCQNQNIADSNAPLANDLRQKVYQMVKDQQTDKEIKEYLVKRYGEFILLEPRWNHLTWFLWLFPFLGMTLALSFVRKLYQA